MLKSVNGLITVDVFDLVSGSLFLLESKSDNNNKDNNVAFEFCCFLIMLLLLFLRFSKSLEYSKSSFHYGEGFN